jgi:hypothetical protein
MLDNKAYKPPVTDDADSDLVSQVDDPSLLKAFIALERDLGIVVEQIALDKESAIRLR